MSQTQSSEVHFIVKYILALAYLTQSKKQRALCVQGFENKW